MTDITVREYRLRRRPVGIPTPDDFELASRSLRDPEPGELRVRNLFLSVDPYMRGRMSDAKSYVPPYELGAPMDGAAVGQVERSEHPDYAPGDLVLSAMGWREGFLSDGKGLTKVDPAAGPPQAFLGTLGMPGLTAYAGLLEIGKLGRGETVLVSGAAGAVGTVVCQIAKARDCRVIGVVGSDHKAQWLERNAGVDATINYRSAGPLHKAIAAAAPDGIDLTFENVGGEHLDAALACSKTYARVVICGLIAHYNATEAPPGLRNVRNILTKRLTVRGFIVFDHHSMMEAFHRDMAAWMAAGRMRSTDTIVEGFTRMPEAFLGLFEGTNLGKMVVKVDAA
jgi:NADPH-dependent curcumin reductase CurA